MMSDLVIFDNKFYRKSKLNYYTLKIFNYRTEKISKKNHFTKLLINMT